ncbi:hypothetical protein [Streptomyces sp. NA04227]|uniref:hypothetical protein n=1 Tax=Streptomyces sp. NA04227 TaxID=2742136 RepID=UPI0020CA583F|nr:hypothetical protein [Streptomyces sp. NA04227]
MGRTHDHSDAARRRSGTPLNSRQQTGPPHRDQGAGTSAIGIPRILRRRARWVSARLRHTGRG